MTVPVIAARDNTKMLVWRALYGKVKSALAGGMRQRITRAGVGYSLTIAAVGTLGFLTANNLLFLILSGLVAALLVSGFLNRLSLAGLAVDLLFPAHVCARRATPARLRIRNEKTWMPSFSIHLAGMQGSVYSSALYFPLLPSGRTVEEPVEVHFKRRGIHRKDSFQLRSRFPFGFAERRIQVELTREVLVYPCLDPGPGAEMALAALQGEMSSNQRGRGHDFHRIRPYEPLESARHVDWKASAHTGQLQVREFARDQDPMVEIALDIDTGDEHREWLERAVDCCAYLAWEVASRGSRLRFRTAEFDVIVPAEGNIHDILRYLALVEPRRTRAIGGPISRDSIQVAVSPVAGRMRDEGWTPALELGADWARPQPVIS